MVALPFVVRCLCVDDVVDYFVVRVDADLPLVAVVRIVPFEYPYQVFFRVAGQKMWEYRFCRSSVYIF